MASFDKRRGKWRAQVRRGGHSICKTFLRKSDAEEWARQAERAVDIGADPGFRKPGRQDTVRALIDLHIEDCTRHGRVVRRSKAAVLRRLKENIGDIRVAHLNRERLIKFGEDRADEGAGPATLAVDLSFIGRVLTHAAAVHGIKVNTEAVRLARVALSHLGLVGSARERDRRPTMDELDTLFATFDANKRNTIPMTRVVKFAIASAMRLDEIFRIEWRHLDERTRTIVVPDRKDPRKKDGNDQRVPLLASTGFDAFALLQEQRALRLNGPRCFPYNGRSAGTRFQRVCRELEIVDLHFHDMRHESTSRLFEAGLTIEQVPLVTGHKDWKQLKRYTQLRPESLYAALQAASRT